MNIVLESTTFLSHLIGIFEGLGRRIRICSLHDFCSLVAELKQLPEEMKNGKRPEAQQDASLEIHSATGPQ